MLIIRDIAEQDRDQVVKMMTTFYESPACLHSVPTEHFKRTITETLKGNPYSRILVLQEGEDTANIVGYAALALSWSNEAGGPLIWFDELYLSPETRGKGYGTQVFHWLEDAYPDVKRVRLEVTHENTRAIQLYERLGYEELPYYQMLKDFD